MRHFSSAIPPLPNCPSHTAPHYSSHRPKSPSSSSLASGRARQRGWQGGRRQLQPDGSCRLAALATHSHASGPAHCRPPGTNAGGRSSQRQLNRGERKVGKLEQTSKFFRTEVHKQCCFDPNDMFPFLARHVGLSASDCREVEHGVKWMFCAH